MNPGPQPVAANTPNSSEAACKLCGGETEPWRAAQRLCRACDDAIGRARNWNGAHFDIPARFRDFAKGKTLALGSYLLIGGAGTGKSQAGYTLLESWRKQDPRLKIAAYNWPEVLMQMRRDYSKERGEQRLSDGYVDALRKSDVAMLDDIGAENIRNTEWIQGELYVIVNERWAEQRTTVVTTNMAGAKLATYLGDRIASRLLEMCEPVEMKGPDYRLKMRRPEGSK